MNHEPELALYPKTVFRETLWGEKYFARMAELRQAGARIEMQERGRTNGEWEITYRVSSVAAEEKGRASNAAQTTNG